MDITNRQKLLEQVPLFRTLNSEITEKLASRLEESLCQTNHAIFQSGEIAPALFIVEEGMVALINTVDHQETTLAQLGPGNYLNEQLLDWGRPHTLSARALEPCRILKLSQSAVETILQETYGVKFNLERFFVEDRKSVV